VRIFYAAGASPNAYDISESRLWERNLHDSLVEMGHEVVRFSRDVTWHFTQYGQYGSSPEDTGKFLEYVRHLQSALLEEIAAVHRKSPIDLFFSYFWNEMCDPQTIEEIKALGIKTMNWFCNASYQFHLVASLAPHFDWCLVPEKFRLKDYAAVGAHPVYCQEAANPNVYKPFNLPKEFDVTFIGQAYGDRPGFIDYLLRRGIDIRVWGYGWQNFTPGGGKPRNKPLRRAIRSFTRRVANWGKYRTEAPTPGILRRGVELPPRVVGGVLSDEDLIRMYSRSKINLGFSTCGSTHEGEERILQLRLRDFEVPMSGGFYLVEYMEELEDFFDIGKEIVCYSGPEELAAKIDYYLKNEDEREAIALAGLQRCRRDHTWKRRFENVFREVGLSG